MQAVTRLLCGRWWRRWSGWWREEESHSIILETACCWPPQAADASAPALVVPAVTVPCRRQPTWRGWLGAPAGGMPTGGEGAIPTGVPIESGDGCDCPERVPSLLEG